MKDINVRLEAINLYFVEGKGYKSIAKQLEVRRDNVRNWIKRYKEDKGIPKFVENIVITEPLTVQDILPRSKGLDAAHEQRIKDLEMQVELLRNFLILAERR